MVVGNGVQQRTFVAVACAHDEVEQAVLGQLRNRGITALPFVLGSNGHSLEDRNEKGEEGPNFISFEEMVKKQMFVVVAIGCSDDCCPDFSEEADRFEQSSGIAMLRLPSLRSLNNNVLTALQFAELTQLIEGQATSRTLQPATN